MGTVLVLLQKCIIVYVVDAFFNGSKTIIVSTSWLSFTTIINDIEREIEMPFCLACKIVYESWRVLLVVVHSASNSTGSEGDDKLHS